MILFGADARRHARARLPPTHHTPALRLLPHCVGRLQVMRRYHIQERDDYKKYNKIVGLITKLTSIVKQLDPKDATRIELTDQLLEK